MKTPSIARNTALAVGLIAGTIATACSSAEAGGRRESADLSVLLGTTLPPVTLQSLDGGTVALATRLAAGPTLLIVLGPKDCFSCSSYRLELAILKTKLPGVTPLLIGSGSDQAPFREYFRLDRLESIALLDHDRSLVKSLGARSEPLVLLLDTAGRILWVDGRSTSAASQFPLGRLLPLLGDALQSGPLSIPKTGAN